MGLGGLSIAWEDFKEVALGFVALFLLLGGWGTVYSTRGNSFNEHPPELVKKDANARFVFMFLGAALVTGIAGIRFDTKPGLAIFSAAASGILLLLLTFNFTFLWCLFIDWIWRILSRHHRLG